MISITEAARVLGKKGGKAKSESKRLAAVVNGKKGGRPKMVKGEKCSQ